MYNARIKVKETLNVTSQETLSFSLDRFIADRVDRILVIIAGTAGLLYLVALVPGLILVARPNGIVAASEIYEEVLLVQHMKCGDPINLDKWDEAELSTEMDRIKASCVHEVSNKFPR